MKEIKLTQNQVAIVDDEDYEWLSKWKWRAQKATNIGGYYAVRSVPGHNSKMIYMHREIMGLQEGDRRQIDHVHHNTLDNRRSELRVIDGSGNQQNQRARKGFSYQRDMDAYRARIQVCRKKISLGVFGTPSEAHEAYLRAKKDLHTTWSGQ